MTPPFPSGCCIPNAQSGDLVAKDFKDQRSELHAVFRQEGEAAVLLGMLLVQAPQVCQLLDHLGVEQAVARRRVSAGNVRAQGFRKAILDALHQSRVLNTGTV